MQGLVAHGLKEGALIEGVEGFGGEIGSILVARECEMEFGSALAEQSCGFLVGAQPLVGHWRKAVLHIAEQMGDGRDGAVFGRESADAFVKAAEGIEGVFPGVLRVGDELGENDEAARGAVPGLVIDAAREGGRVGELVLSEEGADFEVGIAAGFQAPEGLEQKFVAKNNGGVALFGAAEGGFEGLLAAKFAESRGGKAFGLAMDAFEEALSGESIEERKTKLAAGNRVVQHSYLAALCDADRCDDQVGLILLKALGLLAGAERERKQVGFGIALDVIHIEEEHESFPVHGRHGDRFADGDILHLARFAREPAPRLDVALKNIFEGGASGSLEHGFP